MLFRSLCFACYEGCKVEIFLLKGDYYMNQKIVNMLIKPGTNENLEYFEKDLKKNERKTKQFLDIIDSGRVFGESPFITLLTIMGWHITTEHCNYNDLNSIRDLRNDFIHGVETPEITKDSITDKQNKYNKCMWILR